ncbi:MAG: type II toxin-antitoxin system VapC family toxin [Kiritimatiellaeota bacterium]|nr:type II toxin-antitoxin system VapC family toxin [Kiritimatiellota bacterium]
MTPFTILPFEMEDTLVYAEIRSDLERKGALVGPLDAFIAAHSLSNKLILVTNNLKEFSLVRASCKSLGEPCRERMRRGLRSSPRPKGRQPLMAACDFFKADTMLGIARHFEKSTYRS